MFTSACWVATVFPTSLLHPIQLSTSKKSTRTACLEYVKYGPLISKQKCGTFENLLINIHTSQWSQSNVSCASLRRWHSCRIPSFLASSLDLLGLSRHHQTTIIKPCGVMSTFSRSFKLVLRSQTRRGTTLRMSQHGSSTSYSVSSTWSNYGVLKWFWHQWSSNDMYAPESIELLQKSGIDFQRHEEIGILPNDFAELMITSGLVLAPETKWISFHRWVLLNVRAYLRITFLSLFTPDSCTRLPLVLCRLSMV